MIQEKNDKKSPKWVYFLPIVLGLCGKHAASPKQRAILSNLYYCQYRKGFCVILFFSLCETHATHTHLECG